MRASRETVFPPMILAAVRCGSEPGGHSLISSDTRPRVGRPLNWIKPDEASGRDFRDGTFQSALPGATLAQGGRYQLIHDGSSVELQFDGLTPDHTRGLSFKSEDVMVMTGMMLDEDYEWVEYRNTYQRR
jgi:hypothetical protein